MADENISTDNEENSSTITLRGVSGSADQNAAAQAKKAGKPKGTYVREVLEETLGDPVGNFARTSPLSLSMDEEIAAYAGGNLDEKSYQNYFPLWHSLAYREVLGLNSDGDLRNILFSNAAVLFTRAGQVLIRSDDILRGVAVAFALFCEVAGRDEQTIENAWEKIFRSDVPGERERYLQHIDEIRIMKKLEPLNPVIEYSPEWGNIRIIRPAGYDHGAWRVFITLNKTTEDIPWTIRFPVLSGRLLTADPGYTAMARDSAGAGQPGFRFRNRRCELHLYTNGIREDDNPVTPQDVAWHLAAAVEDNQL